MSARQFLFGLFLFFAAPLHLMARENPVNGSLTIDGRTYKLTAARAFNITSDGKDAVAVIISAKPIDIQKPRLYPKEEQRWIDLLSISMLPHVQAIYDSKTGELISFQGWADNVTFLGVDQSGFAGKIKMKDKVVSGTGKCESIPGALSQKFEFTFIASLENLDLSQR